MLGAFLFDVGEVLVEDDAVLAGESNEALSARPSDQGQISLAGQLDSPGRKARARNEDRDSHSRCQPTGGVKDLVVCGDTLLEHPAGDLVNRIVPADVFHIDQRFVLMRENATMNGARLEIK